MTNRVIVVGSVNIDVVVTTERLPAPGETVIGGTFSRHHGGKGGKQAVAAARLGARTAFIGAVGDDDFGRAARTALEAEGIDVVELRTMPDSATGVAFILVDARGENSIAVAGGANAALTPARVRESLARSSRGPATSCWSGTRSRPRRGRPPPPPAGTRGRRPSSTVRRRTASTQPRSGSPIS